MKISKKFYRRALFVLMMTAIVTGCAPRYQYPEERAMNRVAILGASESAAYANARDASNGTGVWAKDTEHHHHHQDR